MCGGTLDAATAGDLADVLRSTLRLPARRITVDLSQVRLLDCAGRQCLADIAALAQVAGVDLLVFDGVRQVPAHAWVGQRAVDGVNDSAAAPLLAVAGR